VLFDLPLGARQGEQKAMTVDIDTASPLSHSNPRNQFFGRETPKPLNWRGG
jgi:hypothetical protein